MYLEKNLSAYKKVPYFDGVEVLYANRHTLDFPNHTHNTFNIALVLNQSFNARLPSKLLNAPIGTICITNPDEVHATPCDKATGNTFITFYVSPDVLKEINQGIPVFFKDRVIHDPQLFDSLYFLSNNLQHPLIDFEKNFQRCLVTLVNEYALEISYSNHKIRLFQQFIQEESFEKFSLEKTAKSFGLDKYKFIRLFKQETGLTPNSHIILKRIARAKELIKQEYDDLLEIAVSTGFYDTAHLCKEFKKYTGVTPSTYKDACSASCNILQ